MQPLSVALSRVLQGRRVQHEPIEYLVELAPTVELEAALSLSEQRLGYALMRAVERGEIVDGSDAATTSRTVRRADSDRARALDLVREGRRRDVLALAYGCWCLGLGGRGAYRGVYRPGLGVVEASDAEGSHVDLMREYCECPVGRALKAGHAELLEAALEAAERSRRNQLWRSVPLDLRNVTLESFELVATDPRQLDALGVVRGWLPYRSRWLLLDGGVGVGKTGLAIGAARESGQSWRFVTAPDLLDEIRATFDHDRGSRNAVSEADVMQRFYGPELLILDDLGPTTDWAASVLYQVIAHRITEQRRTIVTTNLRTDEAEAELGPEGKRAMSRIVAAAQPFVVHVEGDDLRRNGGNGRR